MYVWDVQISLINPDIATWLYRWCCKAFKVCFPWTKSVIFAKRHVINQCLHLPLWIFTNVSRTKGFTYDLEQVISSGLKPQKVFTLFKMCFTRLKLFWALSVTVCLGSTICHCVKSGSELLYLMCFYLILSLMSNLLLSCSPHICGGRCCVGWMLSPKTRRCTKREWRRQRYFCPVFEYSLSYMF